MKMAYFAPILSLLTLFYGRRKETSSKLSFERNILIRIRRYSTNYTHENDLSMDRIFWNHHHLLSYPPYPRKENKTIKSHFQFTHVRLHPKWMRILSQDQSQPTDRFLNGRKLTKHHLTEHPQFPWTKFDTISVLWTTSKLFANYIFKRFLPIQEYFYLVNTNR